MEVRKKKVTLFLKTLYNSHLFTVFISRENGKKVSEAKLSDLGTVRSLEIFKYTSTFVGGSGDFDEIEILLRTRKNCI